MIATGMPLPTFSQELVIDHVISINTNLNEAIDDFSKKGFSIKQGRLHENGLINAHIKFHNYSSFELMSIEGEPKDAIAKEYDSLIKDGIKGAYLAFTGLTRNRIESELNTLGIRYYVTPGKLWTYISFPSKSEFAHIFFINYHIDQRFSVDEITHSNGFDKIKNLKIEGTQTLIKLLENFDLKSEKDTQGFVEFQTRTGSVTIMPLTHIERPRIKEVIFGKQNANDTLKISLN
ncbi:VOC family protein [Ekhidna sp.]|uniref:VOC family protein n=1 Tax=Ekhidna sp. TaxID=2608089 RepID=UPI0032F091C9